MKIDISLTDFEKNWQSTGEMIKESPTTFVQTYRHKKKRYKDKFKQIGRNNFMGRRVILESV